MPSLVESSPTVASLCQEPREDLTARRMCNFLSLPRNPAQFTGVEARAEVQDQPQISGLVSSIHSLPTDNSTSPLLSLTLSSAILRPNMTDGGSQGRGWGKGSHTRAHEEQQQSWFGKWEDPETREGLSALT